MKYRDQRDEQPNKPRFDAFMELQPTAPWNQQLRILGEVIDVHQQSTGSVFVHYAGSNPIIQTLLAALCGLYRGHAERESGRWYFHAQLQPNLRLALLALQDKAPSQLMKELLLPSLSPLSFGHADNPPDRLPPGDGPQGRPERCRHPVPASHPVPAVGSRPSPSKTRWC
ncbi:hypothetical protein D9M72_157930 [compost metagenome]|jgi:hypothetical protein